MAVTSEAYVMDMAPYHVNPATVNNTVNHASLATMCRTGTSTTKVCKHSRNELFDILSCLAIAASTGISNVPEALAKHSYTMIAVWYTLWICLMIRRLKYSEVETFWPDWGIETPVLPNKTYSFLVFARTTFVTATTSIWSGHKLHQRPCVTTSITMGSLNPSAYAWAVNSVWVTNVKSDNTKSTVITNTFDLEVWCCSALIVTDMLMQKLRMGVFTTPVGSFGPLGTPAGMARVDRTVQGDAEGEEAAMGVESSIRGGAAVMTGKCGGAAQPFGVDILEADLVEIGGNCVSTSLRVYTSHQ